MTTIKDRLMKVLEFDRNKAFDTLEPMVCYNRSKEDGKPYRKKVSDKSTSVDLAQWERNRTNSIELALADVVEVLELYSRFEIRFSWEGTISPNTRFSKLVNGQSTFSSPAKEALAKLTKAIEEMEKK